MDIGIGNRNEPCCNCDRDEAAMFYTTDLGNPFYLCIDCTSAFELGQVNPDKSPESIQE